MSGSTRRRSAFGVIAMMVAGCAAPVLHAPLGLDGAGDATSAKDARLDHGYALVLDLLRNEAKVDGVLAIKSPRPEVADLLRRIAAAAKADVGAIEEHLQLDPPIDPTSTGLPLLEIDARNRIANAETPGLLFSGGRTFETRMLLTQQKAAQYAEAILDGLAVADPNPHRRAMARAAATRWKALERQIRAWLTVIEEVEHPPQRAASADSGFDHGDHGGG